MSDLEKEAPLLKSELTRDYFAFTEVVDMRALTAEESIVLFGKPLYECWRQTFGQSYPWEEMKTAVRVKAVNRAEQTITVEFVYATVD